MPLKYALDTVKYGGIVQSSRQLHDGSHDVLAGDLVGIWSIQNRFEKSENVCFRNLHAVNELAPVSLKGEKGTMNAHLLNSIFILKTASGYQHIAIFSNYPHTSQHQGLLIDTADVIS
jgi:hypothetical protein